MTHEQGQNTRRQYAGYNLAVSTDEELVNLLLLVGEEYRSCRDCRVKDILDRGVNCEINRYTYSPIKRVKFHRIWQIEKDLGRESID